MRRASANRELGAGPSVDTKYCVMFVPTSACFRAGCSFLKFLLLLKTEEMAN